MMCCEENARTPGRQDAKRFSAAASLFLCAFAFCLVATSSSAAPKDGVGLSKISLPSGPGSIEGLGDSFEPQLNSGTSAYSVKVAIPPGVNGLQPEVVLGYNAGSGNGPFGLSWGWSPMCIQRLTEKGLPTYGSSDVFTFQVEELVPIADGSYRCKNEFAFMRFARSGDGWEVRDKSGKVYHLGTVAESRQMKPGGSVFGDTFKWFVNEVIDTHGNRMEYHYTAYPDSPGQLYCTEIRYSISGKDPTIFQSVVFDYELRSDVFSSFISGFEVRTARRCREIRVLSQGGLVRRYSLGYALNPADPIEPVSTTDAGLTFSLIRRVTQFDNRATNVASFLPPLQFAYTRMDATNGVRGVLSNLPPYSLGNANLAIADINCDSLPDLFYTDPLTGQHTVFYNLGEGLFSGPTNFIFSPMGFTLDVPETQLADFTGDGRVGLVRKYGGEYDYFSYFPNTTAPVNNDDAHPSWGAEQSFAPPFPPVALDDPTMRTLDLDGDKRIDFMVTTPYGFIYYYNRTNQWVQDGIHLWGETVMGDLTAADGVQFDNIAGDGSSVPNTLVKLADMNGDRLLDLVKLTVFGTTLQITYWPNKGRGAWGTRQFMQGTIDLGVIPVEDVFLLDLNGDGLADVVAVGYDYIKYWINQGNGNFSPPFQRSGMPLYVHGTTVLRQADINGNGSTDFLWENWDPIAGAFKVEFYDFLATAKPNLLSLIDNGIGLRTHIEYKTTTDYYVAARKAGNPWHTRLPFASTVVSKITRQLGLDLDGVPGNDQYITELSYFDGYYDGFQKEFRGFGFAKKVERGDDNPVLSPQPSTINSPTTVTRLAFHTGAPDAVDNNGDGRIDEFDTRSGYEEEPLKGKMLWSETTLPTADIGGPYPAQKDGQPASDAVVFTRETNNWRIKLIHTPTNGFNYVDAFGTVQPSLSLPFATTDGKRVAYAFLASHAKQIIEAPAFPDPLRPSPFAPLRLIYSETDVDFFGNTIAERNYGENSPGSTYDDERFTYNTYAINLGAWLLGLPARTLVTDEHSVFVSETRHYYDGSPFQGLPLGQVGLLGDMVRQEQLVNRSNTMPAFSVITNGVGDPRLAANYAISVTRSLYDSYGNLILVHDSLYTGAGQGHEKQYDYDPVFNTYVVTETIRVGNSSADLVAQASYDTGAGVMTGFTDFNGNQTAFQYDSFWRLVGIVKPGDSAQFPTAGFEYRPGDPFRHLYYGYDASGNLSLASTTDTDVASAVTTHQREQAATANTFDTISFTDGAGHKLGTLHENDVSGQWVAKDFKRYTSRGAERKAFLPFLVTSASYSVPADSQNAVTTFYDSPGRAVRTVNPPETTNTTSAVTETHTVYLPLETVLYDEEQANPASPYYLNCHHQLKDGLDRLIGVIETARLNDDRTPAGLANQWLTRYEYDLNDNLTHITDSQGNHKWFRYDGLKRKLFMNDPDRGTMTYTYDDGSNLRQTVDAKAQVIAYTYDGVNRLLTENYLDGLPLPPWRDLSTLNSQLSTNSVAYHYDTPVPNLPQGDGTTNTASNTKGMLAWVQDLSGEEHISYDTRGRVNWVVKRLPDPVFLSTINSNAPSTPLVSYRTSFAYDSLDRATALTYPDNDQVGYTYSPRNLLQNIIGGPSGYIISSILYRPSDQLAEIDYGNGVRTIYNYDPRLRLNALLTISQPSTINQQLINFSYDFDGVSNIKSITDLRPGTSVPAGDPRRNTQLFQYDDLYRITRAQYSFALPGATNNDGLINYRYDRIGNMLSQTSTFTNTDPKNGLPIENLGNMDSGGTAGRLSRIGRQPADAPGPHALTSIYQPSTNGYPLRSYPYDSNGNMLVIDGLTNTWDFKDRLIRVEDTNMVAAYSYDYTDRRVMKRVWSKASNSPPSTLNSQPSTVLYIDKYFEVREHDAPVKYIWNGNTRVARATGNLASNVRVQRLRVHRGMNFASLAVTAANALAQFQNDRNSPIPITAWKLNPATQAWIPVASGETLPA